jgi:hypothetical protein
VGAGAVIADAWLTLAATIVRTAFVEFLVLFSFAMGTSCTWPSARSKKRLETLLVTRSLRENGNAHAQAVGEKVRAVFTRHTNRTADPAC